MLEHIFDYGRYLQIVGKGIAGGLRLTLIQDIAENEQEQKLLLLAVVLKDLTQVDHCLAFLRLLVGQGEDGEILFEYVGVNGEHLRITVDKIVSKIANEALYFAIEVSELHRMEAVGSKNGEEGAVSRDLRSVSRDNGRLRGMADQHLPMRVEMHNSRIASTVDMIQIEVGAVVFKKAHWKPPNLRKNIVFAIIKARKSVEFDL